MIKLSFIIPVHKISNITFECLDKISQQIKQNEIIIVCDFVDFYYPNSTIIKSKKKLYANKARNLGATKATGKYLIFLDSDIIIKRDFVKNLEILIKNNQIDIINFPIDKECSNNFFARYKGFRENYCTFYNIFRKEKNYPEPFYGFACLFDKKVFKDLGGWPENSTYDFIMEHEGFQKKIFESKYKNIVSLEILVDHYHHKNLNLFKNIFYRTYIWTIKKMRNEVIFDKFKSKKNALISINCFFVIIFFPLNSYITIFFLISYFLLNSNFLSFLYKKNGLNFLFFLPIDILYGFCITLGGGFGVINFFINKYFKNLKN